MLRVFSTIILATLLLACGGQSTPGSTGATSAPTEMDREGTVAAADGVSIAYEVLGAGEPALVFVHCWACNRSFWREQAEVFAADHTVVLLDLPGHGESGRDRAEWTLDAYGDDVARVVDHLGLEDVVLVGHSMGGPVSLLAAPRLGDRLDGIVCVDTLHDVNFEPPAEMMQQWEASMREDYEAGMRFGIEGMVPGNPELQEWIFTQALEAEREATLSLIPQFAVFDYPAALAAANVPLRCINATPSGEMSLPTAIDANREHGDFDAVLMDGGHFLQLEGPAELNEKMRQMLAAIEAAE